MSILSTILEQTSIIALSLISQLGYAGIFFLMILESMIVPIPSELVLPFAGFLIHEGRFSTFWVVVASSLGSIVGSLLSYAMGKYGGNALVVRYGKYLLLDEEDLRKTEAWFARKGEITIFFGRFIPVVRHLISIPAGIGNMNLKKFCLYTLLGATLWNGILIYVGYYLGQNWNSFRHYTEPLSIGVVVLIILVGGWFVYRHVKNKKQSLNRNSL